MSAGNVDPIAGQSSAVAAGNPLTLLLREAASGDARAAQEVLSRVYGELQSMARQRLASERVGHTLQATALVNEAYLRLLDAGGGMRPFEGRAHFFHAAAESMRRILVEHARARARLKRDGGGRKVPWDELTGVADLAAADADPSEMLAVDEAIRRLEQQSPDVGAVVRLRFYAGMSPEEAAEALAVSPRTVYRQWSYAKAWLFRELGAGGGNGDGRKIRE